MASVVALPEVIFTTESVAGDETVQIPPTAYTLEGFRAWAKSDDFPRRGKIAFIDGRISVDLTMEELQTHNLVKGAVYRVLGAIVELEDSGEFYTDGVLISNETPPLSQEPDGTFVSWASLRNGRVVLVPREGETNQYVELLGGPDWVMEIVSRSSVTKDRDLVEKYARAGVGEYWLIDARHSEIDFQIFGNDGGTFVHTAQVGEWRFSPTYRRWFRLTRRKSQLDHWRYTLEAQLTPPTG